MPPSQEITYLESLLDELINGIQFTIQSGEVLSDQFQATLAQELNYLFNRIKELRSRLSGGIIQRPPLDPEIPSSNVHSFGYDPKNERLLVKFQGDYPQENGPIYEYEGVPGNIFLAFRTGAIPAKTNGKNKWGQWWKGKTPSLGASLSALIKNGPYPYQRIS